MTYPIIIKTHHCSLHDVKLDCKENCYLCESDMEIPIVFSHIN